MQTDWEVVVGAEVGEAGGEGVAEGVVGGVEMAGKLYMGQLLLVAGTQKVQAK